LTVNGAGRVVDIWTGRLDLKQEQAVFSGLKLKDKYQLATEETGVTRVDFAELKRALAEKRPLLILDVEERDVFAAGHIPGAVNIPADELEARIGEELSQTDTIVVYSDSADLSQRATEIIGAEGFMRVSMLDGGYSQWEKFNREAR
jgi:rhodanese-related sulfurtransferase